MENNESNANEDPPNANEEAQDANDIVSDNLATSSQTSTKEQSSEAIQTNYQILTPQSETSALHAETLSATNDKTNPVNFNTQDESQSLNENVVEIPSQEAKLTPRPSSPLEPELLSVTTEPPCETAKARSDRTSEKSSVDAEAQHLQSLCTNMFQKMTLYLHGEVESTVEDYGLLERMNQVTTEKYGGMLQTAKQVGDSLRQINQKFVNLRPYLEQIEQIEQTVLSLEQAAYKLDGYTKKLEEKFRRIERK